MSIDSPSDIFLAILVLLLDCLAGSPTRFVGKQGGAPCLSAFKLETLLKSLVFFWFIFFLGKVFDPYNQGQLSVVLMYFIGILSITFLTGLSGQISLGQGALMAIGGYTCALGILNLGLELLAINYFFSTCIP